MGKKRFHFEPFWPTIEGFEEVVRQAWTSTTHTGYAVERLDAKIRATARALQAWSQKKVGNVAAQLELARELLHHLEMAQDQHSLSNEESWLRRQLKHHALALASLHRTIMQARSQLDWLSKGDANTSFFHAHASYRKSESFIPKLQVGDQLLSTHEEMDSAVWDFYTNLMGTPHQRNTSLNLQTFYQPPMDLQELDSPISEYEVWKVVKDLPLDKAPGPDGFTG